jgi:hypothetical protein
MAKSKKLTTEKALEQLLGRKAVKRIRRLAEQLALADAEADKKKSADKKGKKKKKR